MQFEKPFLYITRKLTGDPSCTFVEAPALLPPEVQVDAEQVKQWNNELDVANTVPLEGTRSQSMEERSKVIQVGRRSVFSHALCYLLLRRR